MKYSIQRPCPRCGSKRTWRHGSFRRKDGTRQARWLCGGCGRTFSSNTGTSLYYIKKYRLWPALADAMAQQLSIRRTAGTLGVRPATAFRWRHIKLAELRREPQPVLTGSVATCEAYVPYSEKGSRKTRGPGSWGYRLGSCSFGAHRFRRFIDGKPSCVLLACTKAQRAMVLFERGRPEVTELQNALKPLLGAVDHLWGQGLHLARYAKACQHMGVSYEGEGSPHGTTESTQLCQRSSYLLAQFYGWLWKFKGVATRYLAHYVAWFSVTRPGSGMPLAA